MTRVLHIFSTPDDPACWELVDILQKKLGADHEICCTSRAVAGTLRDCRRISSRLAIQRRWPFTGISRSLRDLSKSLDTQVIHAWDIAAATAAAGQLAGTVVVLTVLDPGQCRDVARWLRSLPRKVWVIAANQVVRQRLLASGVSSERVVVIRGPVDFGVINEARSSGIRKTLVPLGGPVILLPGPASPVGGQFEALWAAAIVRQIYPDFRVLLPYKSKESSRLERFVRSIGFEELLIRVDERYSWPQLVACADVMVAAAKDEISTEPLAAAMAAGIPIVCTPLRSTTELIADRSTGLLVRSCEPAPLAARILTALEDSDLRRRVTETARAQAYEVFGVRAFADNYQRVYDNLLNDRPMGDGIADTAMAA